MIVIADLHFGKENDSFPKNGMPSQRDDLLNRLGQIARRAADTGQAIVIAGDVFNRVNPTSAVIAAFFEWLASVDENVYLIGGNHDSGVDWMNLSMVHNLSLPSVTVVTELNRVRVQEAQGYADVVFWPHMPLAAREKLGDKTPSEFAGDMVNNDDIVITHGQFVGSAYSNDIFFEAGDAMEINPKMFPDRTLIVSGHIHEHSYFPGRVEVVYPGSVTINNFGEVDETKGFIEVDLNTREWKMVPFDEEDGTTPWRHVELDLTDKDETELDEDVIAEVADGAIIKITVLAKDYGVVNEALLRSMFNKYGHVTRYETRYVGEKPVVEGINKDVSHVKLLDEWVKETDAKPKQKTLARKLGEEIITEVLG